MEWAYILEQLPRLAGGLLATLWLSAICTTASLLLAYLAAGALFFELPIVSPVLRGYAYLIRNTPLLVQLFFLYYGLPEIGLRMGATVTGIVALSCWGAAYGLSYLRGAIAALPKSLIEGCAALGLRPWHTLLLVVFPIATRAVVPAMMNMVVSITKNTALLQAIGVAEFTAVAMENIATDFQTMEMFLCLLVGYVSVVLALSLLASRIEARLRRGVHR